MCEDPDDYGTLCSPLCFLITLYVYVCVCVLFTLTDRVSTIPSNATSSVVYAVAYPVVCACVCAVIPFIILLDIRFVDVPAGVTQEEGHTGFLHLPPAGLAFIFIARRIQPFLSLVDREVEFCTNDLIVPHLLGIFFFFFFCEEKSQFM